MDNKYSCFYFQRKKISYTEILNLNNNNIHRTLLSNRLKELISFNILKKEKNKYELTEFGLIIINHLNDLIHNSKIYDVESFNNCKYCKIVLKDLNPNRSLSFCDPINLDTNNNL